MTKTKTGYSESLKITTKKITPLATESILLTDCVGRVAAKNISAIVNSPSADTSLKDGYALNALSISKAHTNNPIRLKLIGSIAAGQQIAKPVLPGTASRILTGAKIPEGADAVVAEEFVTASKNHITITTLTEKKKNILPEGSDTKIGETLAKKGRFLTPGIIG